MIWRGFQIVLAVGVITLGASRSFAVDWPASIEVTSRLAVLNSAGGVYTFHGGWDRVGSPNGTFSYGYETEWYLQVTEDGLAVVTGVVDPEQTISLVFIPEFGWQIVSQQGEVEFAIDEAGTDQWFSFEGEGVVFDSRVQSLSYLLNQGEIDPYPENFPDWESASVKIPLGFGFAMTFWAAALALHVPMKWVRSLAEAAS